MDGRTTIRKGAKEPVRFNFHARKGTVQILDTGTSPSAPANVLFTIYPPNAEGKFPTVPSTGVCTNTPLTNYTAVVANWHDPGAAVDRIAEHMVDTADVQLIECEEYLCQLTAWVLMSDDGRQRRTISNGILFIDQNTG